MGSIKYYVSYLFRSRLDVTVKMTCSISTCLDFNKMHVYFNKKLLLHVINAVCYCYGIKTVRVYHAFNRGRITETTPKKDNYWWDLPSAPILPSLLPSEPDIKFLVSFTVNVRAPGTNLCKKNLSWKKK